LQDQNSGDLNNYLSRSSRREQSSISFAHEKCGESIDEEKHSKQEVDWQKETLLTAALLAGVRAHSRESCWRKRELQSETRPTEKICSSRRSKGCSSKQTT